MTDITGRDKGGVSFQNISGEVKLEIGGDLVGGAKTSIHFPAPETVNIQKELAAIREILEQLETPDKGKIDRALTDAQEEATKSEPDKDEVGAALERVMKHAQKADAFTQIVDKLKPHVFSASAWLGTNWYHISKMLGM